MDEGDDGDSGAVARERPAPGGAGERDELARAVRLIDGVLQAEGVSREEVDARLGRPRGATAAFLSRMASGGRAVGEPERQVREILAALELEPEVFFRALYPEAEPARGAPAGAGAPLFARLAAELALAGYAPHPADDPVDGAPPDPAELERRLHEAIRAAEGGGLDSDPPRGPAPRDRRRRF